MTGEDDVQAALDSVGPRLRDLRRARRMTLDDVAAASGISKSTLSRFETAERRATLDLLVPLSLLYRVGLDDLVGLTSSSAEPRVDNDPVNRDGIAYTSLTRRPGEVQLYRIDWPQQERGRHEKTTHEGVEWLLVLRGQLRLELGSQVHELLEGHVAEFDTRVPHWFGPADTQSASAVSLFGPQGEQAHRL